MIKVLDLSLQAFQKLNFESPYKCLILIRVILRDKGYKIYLRQIIIWTVPKKYSPAKSGAALLRNLNH